MNHLATVLLFATSLAAGCAPALEAPRAPAVIQALPATLPLQQTSDDDLREAVFRHLFEHNASAQQRAARVFCLQIEGKADPSRELLRRFEGNKPPVKKASLCTVRHGSAGGTVQDETGAPGLIFRVDSIQRTDPDSAVVQGGYYEANLSASGNIYELARESGRWFVKKDTMRWIS